MTQIDDIRKAFFEEGKSISEISKIYSKDRKTVRKYVYQENFNAPHVSVKTEPEQPKLEPYKKTIDEWLESDLKARRKQRHTAKRVYDRLLEEYDSFDCSYRTVASYVKRKKKSLFKSNNSALPLIHKAGEAQVDFGTADFYENGTFYIGKYLNVSFPYSNAGYIQIFKGENQECLFEGLRAIFEEIGGVPNRLWFDNASTMVTAILKGGNRKLTSDFVRFKDHHGFAAVFCNPNSGNEKGNVENKVGYHRRNLLVPIPEFNNIEQYNSELMKKSLKDHDREHYRLEKTIRELHEEDRQVLLPLPNVPFDCSSYVTYRVNAYGKFTVNSIHTYSTAPKYAGEKILVKFTSDEVIPLDDNYRPVTVHSRFYGSLKQESMDWIPYLTQLSRRSGALKYTGIYTMLPEALQTYLKDLPKGEQGQVLKVLAQLTEKDGFEKAVKSVSEAIIRDVKDLDSLVTLHEYMNQPDMPEKMDLPSTEVPDLPKFKFSADTYDAMLSDGGNEPCSRPN